MKADQSIEKVSFDLGMPFEPHWTIISGNQLRMRGGYFNVIR